MGGDWEQEYTIHLPVIMLLLTILLRKCAPPGKALPLPATKNRPLQKQVPHLPPTSEGNKQEPINGEPQKLFTFIEKVR